MFTYNETFKLYDENYKPYGIDIEACNHLWHKHIRPVKEGMAIAACGNKYFLKTPLTENYRVDYEFSFNYITDFAGATLYAGYERTGHSGYELVLKWKRQEKIFEITLRNLVDDRTESETVKSVPTDFFPDGGKLCRVSLVQSGNRITVRANDAEEISFDVETKVGETGFGRPNFIGEIIYRKAEYSAEVEKKVITPAVKVEIPMEEGGTMPLTMEYELYECSGRRYLRASLDGGPQYRESYPDYDPEGKREQYVVEQWYFDKPYFGFGDKKYYYTMDRIATSDGMHWKGILDVFLGMVDFPLTMTVAVDKVDSAFSFGYEYLWVKGFSAQEGKAEYNFAKDGRYLGKTIFPDTFSLKSPENKYAVSMIEDTVYEAEIVRDHFRRGHFFTEDENIDFEIIANTEKKYITYKAELRNVFDEALEALPINEGKITHSPLPVGVYRVHLFVYYGGEILTEVNTVFEVFDKTGEKCAPLESGLPMLYSTPNEQKYLDRDKFDPWNIGRADNTEHFYAVSSFISYVGEKKRVWEVIKKFGRKWYAWLTKRIYGSHEEATPEKHPEVTKNADYLRYDHDFLAGAYCYWAGKKTYDFFEDFLDKTEGAREVVGKTREEPYTLEHHFKLLKNYKKEFFDAFVEESVRLRKEDVKKLRSYNPDVKFAGYGPFAIYAAHLRSYSLLEYHAFPTNKDLFELFFSGFCQFEDYPASCAYQTYRGPFGVGTMLAKIPSLVFYPEQYKSAIGGCIDGHVKFANPPLGKYDMPLWFNTTLTRDYVYNAAVKTKDGYRFWDTYGFMHGDHHEEQDDAFIKDWKYILRHKPRSKPRSPIFFAEFPKEESQVDSDFATEENWRVFYNRSEEGIAHLYEASRLYGLPMGAFASWDALDTLTENDTDLIILPSIVGLSDIRLEKLRKLYKNGVSLFAVSRIDGLEDILRLTVTLNTVNTFLLGRILYSEDILKTVNTAHGKEIHTAIVKFS